MVSFTSRPLYPCTGLWVGPNANADVRDKRLISYSYRESNPDLGEIQKWLWPIWGNIRAYESYLRTVIIFSWDSKIWQRVPRDSEPRKIVLAKTRSNWSHHTERICVGPCIWSHTWELQFAASLSVFLQSLHSLCPIWYILLGKQSEAKFWQNKMRDFSQLTLLHVHSWIIVNCEHSASVFTWYLASWFFTIWRR
jgi:hypothetical protein